MQRNTRVQITGLKGRKDFNGRHGLALHLTEVDGRYAVKVDGTGGSTVRIKPSNLIPIDDSATKKNESAAARAAAAAEDKRLNMIEVHGLCYCFVHRLEFCGVCAVDHRPGNRMMQLKDGPNLMTRAHDLIDKEISTNQRPMVAPLPGRCIGTPCSSKPSKSLMAQIRVHRGCDPSTYAPWPNDALLGEAFKSSLSWRECIMEVKEERPDQVEPMENASFEVRRTLWSVGKMIDQSSGRLVSSSGTKIDPSPLPRFLCSDQLQMECLFWDVLDVRDKNSLASSAEADQGASDRPEKKVNRSPFIVVRYKFFNGSQLLEAAKIRVQCGVHETPSHRDEIAILRGMLDENAGRLDKGYTEQYDHDLPLGWKVSVIQPLLADFDEKQQTRHACLSCGKRRKKMKTCSRCMEAKYCSRECQVSHWNVHRRTCRNPDEDQSKLIAVDLSKSGLSGPMFPAGTLFTSMNFNQSMSTSASTSPIKSTSTSFRATGKERTEDTLFIIKIQVSPGGPQSPLGMKVYDQKRKLDTYLNRESCTEFDRLDSLIRADKRKGLWGLKGYFNAYISKGKLFVLTEKPLGVQPW